ncbi:MAG TPA: fumarylacetoacetate hydrolase family protein, partial [Anaeromyxobacteraceae bacterium]|nr:fumarylacetoacetate hydrolase family protein [Anaeromyxobacteraceae bacterium]
AAATGGSAHAADAPQHSNGPRGMAKGLTLCTLLHGGGPRLGARVDGGVLDVVEAARLLRMPAPATLDALLQEEQGPALQALVEAAGKNGAARSAIVKEADVHFGPVVTRPQKIVCVGLNYRKHAQEIGAPIPKQPVLFNKYNTALNCHGGTVKLPTAVAKNFDYEVELVMVIGRTAREVSEADALSCVAGYCTGNDFTARDLQLETGGQWMAGKTPDGFAPLGPWFVTADQVDPDKLAIECRVNGETRQSSNTSDFIFNSRQMISYISRIFTLSPGDIIFTGTPEGVIQGKPKEQRVWLKAGDQLACSVGKLGELRFTLT